MPMPPACRWPALEYTFVNTTAHPVDAVFSFHAEHFLAMGDAPRGVRRADSGFTLWQQGSSERPWDEGCLHRCHR